MMKDTKNLPKLPKGWVWTRLGEVCFVQVGYAFKSKDYKTKGTPLLRISNINNNKIEFNENTIYLDLNYKKEYNDFLVTQGDIVIALSGATTGKYGIYNNDEEALLNQRVGRLKYYAPSLIASYYIFYYLDIIRKDILKKAYGAAQPNISASELVEFPLPLPPLAEQHRIVAKIEELFTKLDAGLEALKKTKTLIKRYRQSVLKYAFEGKLTQTWREKHKNELEPASKLLERIKEEQKNKLGKKYKELPPVDTEDLPELPEGWVWTRLGEVGEISSGGTPSTKEKNNFDGSIPWLTPADLSGYTKKFISQGKRNITEKGLKSSTAVILPAGTILFSSRAPIGYVAIAKNEISTNQGFKNLTPYKGVFNEYVYYYLKGNKTRIERYASGTTFLEISRTKFAQIPIPLPPLAEQHKIVEEIEKRFTIVDNVEQLVNQSLKQTERLRQSILKKAFEGKLVPQDPSDEPASKLLERIQQQKEALKKPKKTK